MTSFLLAIVLTEALVEIVVDSVLLASFRRLVLVRFPFGGILFSCGYCMSVWVGVGVAYTLSLSVGLGMGIYEPFLAGLIVHRLSNLWHEILQRVLLRIPFQVVVVRKTRRGV